MILVTHPSVAQACPYGMPQSCVKWSVITRTALTDDLTGDPIMAVLPWGFQKHAILHVCGSCPHVPYNLFIAMVLLLIIQ